MAAFIEQLTKLDRHWLLTINGCHNDFFDTFFFGISSTWTWIPLLLTLVALLWHQYGTKRMLWLLLTLAVVVVLADQLSSSVIKPLVQRFRPTHNPEIGNLVHIVHDYRGGLYGFVSSHAANCFAVALLLTLVLRRWSVAVTLFVWAVLNGWSRIYLGVHYPGDVFCGMLLGCLVAVLCYWAWKHWFSKSATLPQMQHAWLLATTFVVTLAVLCMMAAV